MTAADLLSRPAHQVAPLLLGSSITSTVGGGRVSLRVTEVEAYGGVGEDPGSHAFRRRTARNAAMFGPAGHAYVYFTYGMHWCLCVVTGAVDEAGAVLVRAGEVTEGLPIARERRPRAASDRDLARGPARLTAALAVTGALDGIDLLGASSPLELVLPGPASTAGRSHGTSARTGVGGAGALTPWRFYLHHEPTVSPYRRAAPRS